MLRVLASDFENMEVQLKVHALQLHQALEESDAMCTQKAINQGVL
jgi:hypothetical protein